MKKFVRSPKHQIVCPKPIIIDVSEFKNYPKHEITFKEDKDIQSFNSSKVTDESWDQKMQYMKVADPLDLLNGISNMFVSYEPNFGFDD
jgi:hypothetical protein